MTTETRTDTKSELLEAAKRVLLENGFAGLSTRAVAAEASTQMSQIRYHFGSKEGMVLALFDYMNASLIARQAHTFGQETLSVAEKWALACDYLEDDLASGYVRVLQEMIAVGWSNPAVGDAVRTAIGLWHDLIKGLAEDLVGTGGTLGPFTATEVASLMSAAFIGAESLILLGFDDHRNPTRTALRRIAEVIEAIDQSET